MGHNSVVSGHMKSTGISLVNGSSTRSPGFRRHTFHGMACRFPYKIGMFLLECE